MFRSYQTILSELSCLVVKLLRAAYFCTSLGRTTCQPDLTTFLQPRHIPTRGYNITQSSAPDDGHMVARNMLSNY